MDCRTYKEMLDSYLCDELAVETNHQIQRHAESCPACRTEMGARRELRRLLKTVCGKEQLSLEVRVRICDKLHAGYRAQGYSIWQRLLGRVALSGLPMWVAPALGIVVVAGLSGVLWMAWHSSGGEQRWEVSSALLDDAAGDHRTCAIEFAQAVAPLELPDVIRKLDPAYSGLTPMLRSIPAGMVLHSAHVCDFGERRFVHLVYTHEGRLVSLLVTTRDRRAIDLERLPSDGGLEAQLQRAARDQFRLGAYQTPRHVVLVVSEASDQQMAEQALASPVADYLRRAERSPAIGRLSFNRLILGFAMRK